MVCIHMFVKTYYTICFKIWNEPFSCLNFRIKYIDRIVVTKNILHHSRIITINFFVIINTKKPNKMHLCHEVYIKFFEHATFKSSFSLFFSIFRNFFAFYFQIGIICRHFFHRNIIEMFSHVPFLVEIIFYIHLTIPFFNNFSRVLFNKSENIETRDCFAKIFLNFLFENWFNYFEPTIQLKTFTKLKIT
jgi:hypothetical protein